MIARTGISLFLFALSININALGQTPSFINNQFNLNQQSRRFINNNPHCFQSINKPNAKVILFDDIANANKKQGGIFSDIYNEGKYFYSDAKEIYTSPLRMNRKIEKISNNAPLSHFPLAYESQGCLLVWRFSYNRRCHLYV